MSVILEALDRHANALAAQTAINDSRQSLSYAELAVRVFAFADQLGRLDCGTVGLLADNGAAWVVADLAAQSAGVTLVPLPPYFSESQLEHVIGARGKTVKQPNNINKLLKITTMEVTTEKHYSNWG